MFDAHGSPGPAITRNRRVLFETEAEMWPSRRFSPKNQLQGSGYSGLVLERLVKHVCRVADVPRACIFVRDRRDPRTVIAAAAHGTPLDLVGTRVGTDEGVLGRVLAHGEALLVPNCAALGKPVAPQFSDGATGAAFAPIELDGGVGGVLAVALCDNGAHFGAGLMELLGELAELAAAAIEHAGARESGRDTVAANVDALAAAMDLRDRCTAEHSEDVVELARLVGDMLALAPAAMVELEHAARLHDVGKIRVPDEVLNKPGPLDDDEFAVMRCHSAWGAETLAGVAGLEVVATIVRFHHERWDGGGYPDGLRGPRIPLASRIIAVCDAFGAMTCDRPYRAGMPAGDALAELRASSGTQFDPAVVDAFCDALSVHAPALHG
jgi:HD-GYP domain-containing protein (c-di-GMP phosphodiesterase class II)